ncbi:MAG: methyltransferase domain-containing protein [Flavobacteriales bacterium]
MEALLKNATRMRTDPEVQAHFHASADLYKRWSPQGHLHFGYWRWPMSPFDRKAMLDELVRQVASELNPRQGDRLADLGCGYGAAARLVAREFDAAVEAITIVEEQAIEGQVAALAAGIDHLVCMRHTDFRQTGLADSSIDGAYALESLCYGTGAAKADVIAEIARIVRPGGRLALVDGFLLKRPTGFRARMVHTVEHGWALPCFPQHDAFIDALDAHGFTDIRVRDLSWNVAPCAAHGPLLMVQGWSERRLNGTRLNALEQAHLKSCLLGIALGTQRNLFRYLMITARKY